MPDIPYITVSELNFYLNGMLENEELLRDIFLVGEVSGIRSHGNHLYFTVKDDRAQISAFCFDYVKTYTPVHGEQVLLRGTPKFYQKKGDMGFLVTDIEPFGLGKLHIELEKLKKQLSAEGLFDDKYKKPIPRYPIDVCVIASFNGAVLQDIISTIRKYNHVINISIMDTRVQGDSAVPSIINCLTSADKLDFDVIILARGGGSFEELLPFSDERLIRAMFDLNTPIISAIGHETDYTLADFVADKRALTPTAAAELIAFDIDNLLREIKYNTLRAGHIIDKAILMQQAKIKAATKDIYYICREKLSRLLYRINTDIKKIEKLSQDKVRASQQNLQTLMDKLSLLSPISVLQKGYFKVGKGVKTIGSINELEVGDNINIYGFDGRLSATVTQKELNKSEEL